MGERNEISAKVIVCKQPEPDSCERKGGEEKKNRYAKGENMTSNIANDGVRITLGQHPHRREGNIEKRSFEQVVTKIPIPEKGDGKREKHQRFCKKR